MPNESTMPAPQAPAFSRWRRLWIGGAVLLLLVGGALWLGGVFDRRQPVPEDPFPIPPISESPFKNTTASAHYVGSESCRQCHQKKTDSFRATGMGISTAAIDPANEPPDAVFDHAKSKRRYQIVRKDGKLWHRELLLTDGREEIVLSEYPLTYVVGSGRHARGYLAEAEGFLVESPVSWYEARKAWDMSPGYDRADHMGFARGVSDNCLICHAGHADPIGKSLHRMHIKEAAISCERCHGPGSLHVDLRKAGKGPIGEVDYTIVNPTHLSRELAEAVCQQCHLHSAATVLGRGRAVADFRPGLPLQDFRQDYALEVDDTPMTVVGHVEQMHLSRCWKESKDLTCTSCHNPHAFPAQEKRVDYYRAACVRCHKVEHCKVPKERLQKESPENNCVKCHMPTSPTDVPHVSFTHHRIGNHTKANMAATDGHSGKGALKPIWDYPKLGEIDKKRSLGLAYLTLSKEEKGAGQSALYKGRGFELLSDVHRAGLRDGALEATLARMHFEQNGEQAMTLAESALKHERLNGLDRTTALFVLAAERLKRKRMEEARLDFRDLVTRRRHADDWLVLADCEKALGNQAAAVQALQSAARINPRLVSVHQFLAQHFQRQGDAARAAFHQKRAVP